MDLQNAPIDLEHLARQTMSDPELQREILSIFVKQMTDKIEQLQKQMSELDALAHSIKGSARGVGAWQVANVAEQLERGKGPRADVIILLARAMEDAVHHARLLLETS
ncbi:Hpt domain-containing protein [uncultured Cohaesibacter sp.]|uniref:Hpt domain-containing protein n=1 Tax=uncultured Cohaesibacter sp. TaxID=1002546 RepID=UPI00292E0D92|nr:Hpt domain-containing protein [uncultured Cohaesibacter sp.]